MQAPAAASPSERVILLHKRLSMSDLSDSVLLTGRIVLPRVQMELNVGRIIAAGTTGASSANPDTGSSQYPLVVVDAQGRQWELLLKQWTAHSAPQPRPIFVLERTAGCMKANRASPGHFLQLWVDTAEPNVLRVTVLTAAQAAAAPAAASDWGAAAAAAGQAIPAGGDTAGLACMRSAGCARGAGHPGYCSTTAAGFTPAAQPCPTWISLRCGSARADLHVHTLRVSPLDSRGRVSSGVAISLSEFQRRASGGGRTAAAQPVSSMRPVIVEGTGMTLQRWLASWGLPVEGLGIAEAAPEVSAGVSAADIESDVEAGEVLMSIMSGGGAASHATLFAAPTKQEEPVDGAAGVKQEEKEPVTPASKFNPAHAAALTSAEGVKGEEILADEQPVRPLASHATQQATEALYVQLAAEAAAGVGVGGAAGSVAVASAASRLDQLTKRARLAKYLAGVVLSAHQAAANQAAAMAAAAAPAAPRSHPLQS